MTKTATEIPKNEEKKDSEVIEEVTIDKSADATNVDKDSENENVDSNKSEDGEELKSVGAKNAEKKTKEILAAEKLAKKKIEDKKKADKLQVEEDAKLQAKAEARADEIEEEQRIQTIAAGIVLKRNAEAAEELRKEGANDQKRTVAANSYDSAMELISSKKMQGAVKIPRKIPKLEKGYFHLIAILSKANEATLVFEHKSRIVKLSPIAWDKHKRHHKSKEYFVIFHNPELS